MKGVIVKAGEPKSIVLLNNGKIMAIPTPVNCHEGMVVTVKFSGLLKIIIFSSAAVFLVALGIFIGSILWGGSSEASQNDPPQDALRQDMPRQDLPMPMHRHMMEQRR